MPRVSRIISPATETDDLVPQLRALPGLISLEVHRGASLYPSGDVLVVDSTDQGLVALIRDLDSDPSRRRGIVVTTIQPASVISTVPHPAQRAAELLWEEIDSVMRNESGMSPSALVIMAISGFLSALGLAAGTLHLVIAGMLIAPAFEPISRIALGWASGSRTWIAGARDTLKGYVALIAGAAASSALLAAFGTGVFGGKTWYDPTSRLVGYWTSFDPSIMVSIALASAAGVLLIVTGRAILTGGAVIALGLVPTAAVIPLAIALADARLAAQAAARWGIEAALVLLASLAVFGWKRVRVHRRTMIG